MSRKILDIGISLVLAPTARRASTAPRAVQRLVVERDLPVGHQPCRCAARSTPRSARPAQCATAATQKERLTVERLPGYAHDLHSVETVRGNCKSVELANLCPDTIDEAYAATGSGFNHGSNYDLRFVFLDHSGHSLRRQKPRYRNVFRLRRTVAAVNVKCRGRCYREWQTRRLSAMASSVVRFLLDSMSILRAINLMLVERSIRRAALNRA